MRRREGDGTRMRIEDSRERRRNKGKRGRGSSPRKSDRRKRKKEVAEAAGERRRERDREREGWKKDPPFTVGICNCAFSCAKGSSGDDERRGGRDFGLGQRCCGPGRNDCLVT